MKITLQQLLSRFKNQKILVIGDAMLDCYLQGNVNRICPDAPVPIVDVKKNSFTAGGAANTAVNTATLGAKTSFLSVIGDDKEGEMLLKTLADYKISTDTIIKSNTRKTLTKTRIMADNHMLVRFDAGTKDPLDENLEEKLLTRLIDLSNNSDAIIISDYDYGIITPKVITMLAKIRKKTNQIITIDSKYPDAFSSIHATVIKPNYKQVLHFLGITRQTTGENRIKQIENYKDTILEKTGADSVAVTLDQQGSLIFEKDKATYRVYASSSKNAKPSGAGDTYISAFTLALTSGAGLQNAGEIASVAASISIRDDGTSYATLDELQYHLEGNTKYIPDKKKLKQLVEQYRKQGKKIVFTNGCFDIIHSGHVSYLHRAKQLGDLLIVALNTDESIKRTKGNNRPINTLKDRIAVIGGLSSVDHIVSFSEDLPHELIKIIKPVIHAKGGDYKAYELPEASLIKKLGGRIEIIPLIQDKSTTTIIEKIRSQFSEKSLQTPQLS